MKESILRCVAATLKWFFGLLSPGVAGHIGIIFGDIARFLDIRHRRIVRLNLRLSFGDTKTEKEIRRIIRELYRNLGQTSVEFIRIPGLRHEDALEIMTPEIRERLDDYLRLGQGVILLGSHFGNWELMAAAGAMAGYKISAVARPIDDPHVDKIVREIRESSGLEIVGRRSSALAIVRRLKKNEIVGILADQNTRKQNVFVDFFGIKAATTPGPALLALRTGALLVPAFLVREGIGKHRLIVEDPIDVVRTGNQEADVVATTQKCVDILEKYVRKYPSQWFWVHRRWRTRPRGEPPIYWD